jgi:IclR family transcriptional regulator, KDG regulon repressor
LELVALGHRLLANRGRGLRVTGEERTSGSQAIERALAILACFSLEDPTITLTDIIARTGLKTATAHRMLRALERERFVVRDPHTSRYGIGSAVVQLAQIPLSQAASGDLVALALPYLDGLRNLTGETVGLHVVLGEHRICMAELVSHHPIRMASGVGQMRDLGVGAAGKVITAFSLDETGGGASTGRRVLARGMTASQAASIRSQGYATSLGETVVGAAAIAVPVLGPGTSVIGAINVTGPDTRWTLDKMQAAAEVIMQQGAFLSAQVGGSPAR